MSKCYGCEKTITKYNTNKYKGFCCRRSYNWYVRNYGKKAADMMEASNKRVLGRLNKVF